jgi:hypothetical protein
MEKAIPTKGIVYSVEPREVLRFQIERNVKAIFGSYLAMLEDLGVEHDIALNKLAENLPAEYARFVDLADYLTDDKGTQLRKRVLDVGNNHLRQINDVLEGFEVTFRTP